MAYKQEPNGQKKEILVTDYETLLHNLWLLCC